MKSKTITLYNTEISKIAELANDKPKFLNLISKRNFFNRKGFLERLVIKNITENSLIIKHITSRDTTVFDFQKFPGMVTLQISTSSFYYLFFAPFLMLFRNFFKSNTVDDVNGELILGIIIFSSILGVIGYLGNKFFINKTVVRFEKEYAKLNLASPQISSKGDKTTSLKTYFIHNGISKEGPYCIDELKGKISKETFAWKEGMADWVSAEIFPELKELFPKMPPLFNIPENLQAGPPDFKLKNVPPIFNPKP